MKKILLLFIIVLLQGCAGTVAVYSPPVYYEPVPVIIGPPVFIYPHYHHRHWR